MTSDEQTFLDYMNTRRKNLGLNPMSEHDAHVIQRLLAALWSKTEWDEFKEYVRNRESVTVSGVPGVENES